MLKLSSEAPSAQSPLSASLLYECVAWRNLVACLPQDMSGDLDLQRKIKSANMWHRSMEELLHSGPHLRLRLLRACLISPSDIINSISMHDICAWSTPGTLGGGLSPVFWRAPSCSPNGLQVRHPRLCRRQQHSSKLRCWPLDDGIKGRLPGKDVRRVRLRVPSPGTRQLSENKVMLL